jgi:glycine/D-amino acid oxidase-like deaminating enzyme
MSPRPDVAVVGAGIVGLSIAFQLRELGAAVTVVDRAGVGAGASGVQPGGVRQQWGTPTNCLLVQESLRFYAGSVERLQMRVDPGFRKCGYLFLAHSEPMLERLQANVALQNTLGVPSRIVAPAEATELVRGLDAAGILGGAWCGEDGYFDRPQAIVEALGALMDVELAEIVDVEDLAADAVVVAAGVDTARLLPELPIRPERRSLFFSDRIRERVLEPLVVSNERGIAAKQLADGRLLASDLRAGSRANVRSAFEELLPRLVYVALPTLVEGLYDVTPDHQPILGQVRDRVWVASGFSGRGFMQAPAIGRIVAESVLGAGTDPALTVFDARRFAEGRLVPEPSVV